MSCLNCVCTSQFDPVYSHKPGAPYGDQKIGINLMKSSEKEQLCTARKNQLQCTTDCTVLCTV